MGRVDLHLVLDGKGLRIERPGGRKHVVDQGLRYAVILDVKEANRRSCLCQVVGHGFEACRGSAMQLANIDYGYRVGIDYFRGGVAHVRPSWHWQRSNGVIRRQRRLEAVTVAFLAAPFKPRDAGSLPPHVDCHSGKERVERLCRPAAALLPAAAALGQQRAKWLAVALCCALLGLFASAQVTKLGGHAAPLTDECHALPRSGR